MINVISKKITLQILNDKEYVYGYFMEIVPHIKKRGEPLFFKVNTPIFQSFVTAEDIGQINGGN